MKVKNGERRTMLFSFEEELAMSRDNATTKHSQNTPFYVDTCCLNEYAALVGGNLWPISLITAMIEYH